VIEVVVLGDVSLEVVDELVDEVSLELVGDVSLEVVDELVDELVDEVSLELVGDVSLDVVLDEVVGEVSLDVVLDEVVGVVSLVVLLDVELSVALVEVCVVPDEVVEVVDVVPPRQCEITNCPLQPAGRTAVASVTDTPSLSDTMYLPVEPGALSSDALVSVPSDRNTVMLDGGSAIWVITKYAPVEPEHPSYSATEAALTCTVWVSVAAADGAVCSISMAPSPAAAMPPSSRTRRPEVVVMCGSPIGRRRSAAAPTGGRPADAWRSFRYGTYP